MTQQRVADQQNTIQHNTNTNTKLYRIKQILPLEGDSRSFSHNHNHKIFNFMLRLKQPADKVSDTQIM